VSIIVRLDVVMARNKIHGNDLAEKIGITQANLSKLKFSNTKAIKLKTLEAICRELGCQPGDIFE